VIAGAELETFIRITLGPDAAERLCSKEGLPLWGSIGFDAFLARDGAIWSEREDGVRQRVTGPERLTHLLIAAERRPELQGLLPIRPPAARTCARCSGQGTLELASAVGEVYLVMNTQPLRFYCPACGGIGFDAE